MIRKTQPMCKTCNHPQRMEIEQEFLLKKKEESFQTLWTRLSVKYNISEAAVKRHFLGSTRDGARRSPHFMLEVQKEIEDTKLLVSDKVKEALRHDIETKGLMIVSKNFDQIIKDIESGKLKNMSPKDLANILKSVTHSEDSRKILTLKKAELDSKNKHYDRMFNKALYDDEPAVIQDAEIEQQGLLEGGV